VASCPNSAADPERARAALALGEDEQLFIVLSFGYPARKRDPSARTADQWSAAARRKPLADVVRHL
jgi:hypothetical protein